MIQIWPLSPKGEGEITKVVLVLIFRFAITKSDDIYFIRNDVKKHILFNNYQNNTNLFTNKNNDLSFPTILKAIPGVV